MSALGIDIDLREDYLEEALEHDAECESPHAGTNAPECTVAVVAKRTAKCCGVQSLVCSAIVASLSELKPYCARCDRPAEECWTVVPV